MDVSETKEQLSDQLFENETDDQQSDADLESEEIDTDDHPEDGTDTDNAEADGDDTEDQDDGSNDGEKEDSRTDETDQGDGSDDGGHNETVPLGTFVTVKKQNRELNRRVKQLEETVSSGQKQKPDGGIDERFGPTSLAELRKQKGVPDDEDFYPTDRDLVMIEDNRAKKQQFESHVQTERARASAESDFANAIDDSHEAAGLGYEDVLTTGGDYLTIADQRELAKLDALRQPQAVYDRCIERCPQLKKIKDALTTPKKVNTQKQTPKKAPVVNETEDDDLQDEILADSEKSVKDILLGD